MPYLEKSRRKAIEAKSICIDKGGDVNYVVTQLCQNFLALKGESYATYNELIGALECAKLELYRRKTGPYEDLKIKQHGDVWL